MCEEKVSMDINELFKSQSFIYRCDRCTQKFPIWWTTKQRWRTACKKGGWGEHDKICKQCFEEVAPKPRYLSIDAYIEERLDTISFDPITDRMKEVPDWGMRPLLEKIWDLHGSYYKKEDKRQDFIKSWEEEKKKKLLKERRMEKP
jgi:hypothetical protein